MAWVILQSIMVTWLAGCGYLHDARDLGRGFVHLQLHMQRKSELMHSSVSGLLHCYREPLVVF